MKREIINVTSRENVPSWGNQKKYIAIHYLGVVGQSHEIGADGCGAHFYIYWDGTIYQRCSLDAIPWAVGTAGYYKQKHPLARNSNTISIEMCCKCDGNSSSATDSKWYFTPETQEACAWLIGKLRRDLGVPHKNVLRHYDIVNKVCPAPYVKNNKYRTSWTWEEFKKRSNQYYYGKAVLPLGSGIKIRMTRDVLIRSCIPGDVPGTKYKRFESVKNKAFKPLIRESARGWAVAKKGAVVTIKKVKADKNGNTYIKALGGWIPAWIGRKMIVEEV